MCSLSGLPSLPSACSCKAQASSASAAGTSGYEQKNKAIWWAHEKVHKSHDRSKIYRADTSKRNALHCVIVWVLKLNLQSTTYHVVPQLAGRKGQQETSGEGSVVHSGPPGKDIEYFRAGQAFFCQSNKSFHQIKAALFRHCLRKVSSVSPS